MLEVDGSEKSGSGTILRYSLSLSALLGEELRIFNIRAKRPKPGLRPQHLKSVEACAQLCNAKLEGAYLNSTEIRFEPGEIKGGDYEWKIGTAGSTTMLAMTLLPVACFADRPTTFRIEGGLFQDFAPSAFHMQHVLFPTLKKMGVEAELKILKPGYVPTGRGMIEVKVEPVRKIRPLQLLRQGEIKRVEGIALSSHLRQQKVSERMARECKKWLRGYEVEIKEIYDTKAEQKGAALAVWATNDCILGADRAGKPGRSSEQIGRYVAQSLLQDVKSGATVDRHLADQLISYGALADGITKYRIPTLTEHVETNLWLVEKLLGAETKLEGNLLTIKGIGYSKD